MTDSTRSSRQGEPNGFRYVAVYEIDGRDEQEATAVLTKLNRAAKRLGVSEGFIDNSGAVTLDEQSLQGGGGE